MKEIKNDKECELTGVIPCKCINCHSIKYYLLRSNDLYICVCQECMHGITLERIN